MATVQDQAPVQETVASKPSETVALLAENGHAHCGKAGPEENMHGRSGKRDRAMASEDVQGVPPSSNDHVNGKDAPPTSEVDTGAPETVQLQAERLAVEATGAQQALEQAISVVVEKKIEASAAAKEVANEFSVGKDDTKTSAVQDTEEVLERASKQQKLDLSSTDAFQQDVQNDGSIAGNAAPVVAALEEPTPQNVAQTASLKVSTEECVTAVQDGMQPTEGEDKPFTLKVVTQTPQGPSPMQVG